MTITLPQSGKRGEICRRWKDVENQPIFCVSGQNRSGFPPLLPLAAPFFADSAPGSSPGSDAPARSTDRPTKPLIDINKTYKHNINIQAVSQKRLKTKKSRNKNNVSGVGCGQTDLSKPAKRETNCGKIGCRNRRKNAQKNRAFSFENARMDRSVQSSGQRDVPLSRLSLYIIHYIYRADRETDRGAYLKYSTAEVNSPMSYSPGTFLYSP